MNSVISNTDRTKTTLLITYVSYKYYSIMNVKLKVFFDKQT